MCIRDSIKTVMANPQVKDSVEHRTSFSVSCTHRREKKLLYECQIKNNTWSETNNMQAAKKFGVS